MGYKVLYTLFLFIIAAVFSSGKDYKPTRERDDIFKFSNIYRVALPSQSFPEDRIKSIDRYFRDRSYRGYFNGVVLVADSTHIFTKAYG